MLTGFFWILEGKLAASAKPGLLAPFEEDLEDLRYYGIDLVVTLTELPLEPSPEAHGLAGLHFPIPDMGAPFPKEAADLVDTILRRMDDGETVLVHCRAGKGRTGTILACCLVAMGKKPAQALMEVRRINPYFVESAIQEQFISDFGDYIVENPLAWGSVAEPEFGFLQGDAAVAPAKEVKQQRFPGGRAQEGSTATGRVAVEPGAVRDLNDVFNAFLNLNSDDTETLAQRKDDVLGRNGDSFAEFFYDYLRRFPETKKILDEYEAGGGDLKDLVRRQVDHLHAMFTVAPDADSAESLIRLGEIHHRWNVQPPWILGSYHLYLNYLRQRIGKVDTISREEAETLGESLTRRVFREVGLMLEGYWKVAQNEVQVERDRVVDLQQQVSSLLDNIPQMVWSVSVENPTTPLYVSAHAADLCGDVVEMPIPGISDTVESDREILEAAWTRAVGGERVEVESQVVRGGQSSWFKHVLCPFVGADGEVVRVDGVLEDITEARQLGKYIESLAMTDILTGLPNQTLFRDRLSQACLSRRRRRAHDVVLVLLDINLFKDVNEALGHAAGDQVLVEVGRRIKNALRDSDTVARLGGDEFALLLPNESDGKVAADIIITKILEAFREPFTAKGREVYLKAAMGIAICDNHDHDVNSLMRHAEAAMYASKVGHTDFEYFEPSVLRGPEPSRQIHMSGQLLQAMERDELTLHYQPIVELSTGTPVCAEALIRWNHADGILMPDAFLGIAERAGLTGQLTDWVLRAAAQQVAFWKVNGHDLAVAVNVSPYELHDPELASRLLNELSRVDATPDQFWVEITEHALISDLGRVNSTLQALAEAKVHLSIDDFGTGYSSLERLRALPLNTLKIDRSFIMEMSTSSEAVTIVRSTIDLAHGLGYRVVAEGIEDEVTYQAVKDLGCDYGQGRHICPPQPVSDLHSWLATHSRSGGV